MGISEAGVNSAPIAIKSGRYNFMPEQQARDLESSYRAAQAHGISHVFWLKLYDTSEPPFTTSASAPRRRPKRRPPRIGGSRRVTDRNGATAGNLRVKCERRVVDHICANSNQLIRWLREIERSWRTA